MRLCAGRSPPPVPPRPPGPPGAPSPSAGRRAGRDRPHATSPVAAATGRRRRMIVSAESGSGERAESLGVRRPVELPETDVEAAEGMAPADSDQKPAPEPADETAPAGEKTAEAAPSAAAAGKKDAAAATAQDIAVERPPGDGAGDYDGMPPDRPKKPVLAGVAIGGAVVLAIPILLIGTGSHHEKKHPTAAAANTSLPGDVQPPAWAFTSPSPTPTPSATPGKKEKKAKKTVSPTPSAKPSASVPAVRKAAHERPSPSAPTQLVVRGGRDLYPGQTLRTSRIALTMQRGGNLVLRDRSNKIIWSTGTHRSGVYAEFQTDVNLVLYRGDRKAVWAAGSFGHEHSTMVLQSDYNLVIIDRDGHPVCATGTNR